MSQMDYIYWTTYCLYCCIYIVYFICTSAYWTWHAIFPRRVGTYCVSHLYLLGYFLFTHFISFSYFPLFTVFFSSSVYKKRAAWRFFKISPYVSHVDLEQHEGKEFSVLISFAYLYYLIAAVIFSHLPWLCLVSMTRCPALVSWGFCRSDTGHYLPSAHPGVCVCVS